MSKQATLAIVTIGQAPRVDLHADLAVLLGTNVKVLEFGALDGFTLEQINTQYPIATKRDILVSRMQDGRQVQISEQDLEPLLERAVHKAEAANPDAILILCTGDLPEFNEVQVPVLSPKKIVEHFFAGIGNAVTLIVMSPDAAQMENTHQRWLGNGFDVQCLSGSPYLNDGGREHAAQQAKELQGNLIYLDCMGYQLAQRDDMAHIAGKSVITPREIIFNTVRLLLK